MTLTLLAAALGLLALSSVAVLLAWRHSRVALWIGTVGALMGCGIGLGAAVSATASPLIDVHLPFPLAIGELHVGVDALSAFFLICIFIVSALAALYGLGYLRSYENHRRLAAPVALFNLLVMSMVGVVIARDGILFLMAWELMTLSSLFLVTFEHQREDVRRAGITYLIASQAGVVLLLILFAILGVLSGSFSFSALRATDGWATTCFWMALIGFGTKAGFWPFHIWLPDAHPAAPSHVSALMSGVMIKMGIYGLLRSLDFLGPPAPWWGATLVVVGVISGVLGVLHALAQHDLKRLLAYHSVENIGIIALGLGIGLLGRSLGYPTVATLGFAGALLHVLNHGLFKGLLFEGAGAVLQATHQRNLDSLGGLARKMPVTAVTFLIGCLAICGLPPFNGFISEWLIYMAAFNGAQAFAVNGAIFALLLIASLALIGGLAATCFVKAYGVVFLGEPRQDVEGSVKDPPVSMRAAMVVGALACTSIGLAPALALRLVNPAALRLGGANLPSITSLRAIVAVFGLFLGLVCALALLRWFLLRGRQVGYANTWSCGYEATTPRMQYTAESFAAPVLEPFAVFMPAREHTFAPEGPFPTRASCERHVPDLAGERVLVPLVSRLVGFFSRTHVIQHGRVQLYLVYMLVALIVLLAWQTWGV